MARIAAVTGATGFIGSTVVRHLAKQGWQVRILTRRLPLHPLFADLSLEAVVGSLEDEASLCRLAEGVTAIVHAAGLTKACSRADFFRVNCEGVGHLANAATHQAVAPRIILVSSLAAREPHLSAYAASKRAGEQALIDMKNAPPWTILRPPVVYGPGDPATLPLVRLLRWRIGPMLGPESARFSILHVDDFASAVAVLLSSEKAIGATYELDDGTSGGYTWRSLLEIAQGHLPASAYLVRVPHALLQAAAMLGGLLCLVSAKATILSLGKVRELYHRDWTCDNSEIAEQTTWQPRIRFADAVPSLLEWAQRGELSRDRGGR